MQTIDAKPVTEQKRVKNLLNKKCARILWNILTRTPHSTQELFHDLLTAASVEEALIKTTLRRNALKSTLAAVWECARYGWQQTCFGRPVEPKATLGEIRCRRTRVLMRRAVNCGYRIAKKQSE